MKANNVYTALHQVTLVLESVQFVVLRLSVLVMLIPLCKKSRTLRFNLMFPWPAGHVGLFHDGR